MRRVDRGGCRPFPATGGGVFPITRHRIRAMFESEDRGRLLRRFRFKNAFMGLRDQGREIPQGLSPRILSLVGSEFRFKRVFGLKDNPLYARARDEVNAERRL